jgi:hypothetical protein
MHLLALDDFGAQPDMPWAQEQLCQLVNYRVHPSIVDGRIRRKCDSLTMGHAVPLNEMRPFSGPTEENKPIFDTPASN